jgi:hypothetical protein
MARALSKPVPAWYRFLVVGALVSWLRQLGPGAASAAPLCAGAGERWRSTPIRCVASSVEALASRRSRRRPISAERSSGTSAPEKSSTGGNRAPRSATPRPTSTAAMSRVRIASAAECFRALDLCRTIPASRVRNLAVKTSGCHAGNMAWRAPIGNPASRCAGGCYNETDPLPAPRLYDGTRRLSVRVCLLSPLWVVQMCRCMGRCLSVMSSSIR